MVIEDEEDDQDELLDSYNGFLWVHIKSNKRRKKALESLEEKEKEFNLLKATLEKKKSFVSSDHSDFTKKCEMI